MLLFIFLGEYETILNLVSHKGQYSDDTQRHFFENVNRHTISYITVFPLKSGTMALPHPFVLRPHPLI